MITIYCTNCIHKEKTMHEQPCLDCLESEERPYYERPVDSTNMQNTTA